MGLATNQLFYSAYCKGIPIYTLHSGLFFVHLRKNSARQKTQHFSKTQGQNPKTQLFGSHGPKSFQVHHKKHSTELFKTKFWALENAMMFVCRCRIFRTHFWNQQILQLALLIGVQKFNFLQVHIA